MTPPVWRSTPTINGWRQPGANPDRPVSFKGTHVGTVTVEYFNGTAKVTYSMSGVLNPVTRVAYSLVEAQLYVGAEILPTDVNGEFTVAPGQYPDVAGELKNVARKEFTVTGLSGSVYLVAHATVAGFPL